jgi:hypothetical protein
MQECALVEKSARRLYSLVVAGLVSLGAFSELAHVARAQGQELDVDECQSNAACAGSTPTAPVLALVYIESKGDEEAFLRGRLMQAFQDRGFEIITCKQDIEHEVDLIALFGSRGIHRADDSPNRVGLLKAITRSGCQVGSNRSIWAASLTVHSDARANRREVVLRLANVAEPSGSSRETKDPNVKFASVIEPTNAQWSWSTLIETVVNKALRRDVRPSVRLPAWAKIRAGSAIRCQSPD